MFEDFIEGKSCFFDYWAEVADIDSIEIRKKKSKKDINKRTDNYIKIIVRN